MEIGTQRKLQVEFLMFFLRFRFWALVIVGKQGIMLSACLDIVLCL